MKRCEFLARLNFDLDDVRGQILGRLPLSTTREVFKEVTREQSHRSIMMKDEKSIGPVEDDGSAFITKGIGLGLNGHKEVGLKV